MKTHTHYTIPIAMAPWLRHGAVALVALLALLAVSFGLSYALRPATRPARLASAARASQQLIADCRACVDEAIGADQANLAFLAPRTTTGGTARPSAARSRVFQDEILGADQANLATLTAPAGAFGQPVDVQRRLGPR